MLVAFGLLCLPFFVSAHTRWFAEEELEPFHTTEPTVLYLAVWAVIAITILYMAVKFHEKGILRLAWLKPKKPHAYERAASTFTMVAGSFFLIAGTHEYLFSPNQSIEAGVPYYLIVVQIFIGLAFLLGIATRTSAIILALTWLSTFYYLGYVSALEDVWVLSTAIFIAIMGNDYFSLISFSYFKKVFKPFNRYALSILRLGTGATLVTLGFTEKLLSPEFGMNFLKLHDWNFMQALGLPYSDYLFVLSAGSVEILLGLLLILGLMTRIVALVIAIIFTIPLFILGPIELAGHLPHFAAVVLLLIFGSGGRFMFFHRYNDSKVRV